MSKPNAFTAKPDTSWMKKADRDRKTSEIMSKKLETPTERQKRAIMKPISHRRGGAA